MFLVDCTLALMGSESFSLEVDTNIEHNEVFKQLQQSLLVVAYELRDPTHFIIGEGSQTNNG